MEAWLTWVVAVLVTLGYFGLSALAARFIEPVPWRRRGPWIF